MNQYDLSKPFDNMNGEKTQLIQADFLSEQLKGVSEVANFSLEKTMDFADEIQKNKKITIDNSDWKQLTNFIRTHKNISGYIPIISTKRTKGINIKNSRLLTSW